METRTAAKERGMSAELQAFRECTDKVIDAVKTKVRVLSLQLYNAGLIGYSERKMAASGTAKRDGTTEVIRGVEKAIEEDPQNFTKFIKVLEKNLAFYHKIISDLRTTLVTMVEKANLASFSEQPYSNSQPEQQPHMKSMSMVLPKPTKPRLPPASEVVCVAPGGKGSQRKKKVSAPACQGHMEETAPASVKQSPPKAVGRRHSVDSVRVRDTFGHTGKLVVGATNYIRPAPLEDGLVRPECESSIATSVTPSVSGSMPKGPQSVSVGYKKHTHHTQSNAAKNGSASVPGEWHVVHPEIPPPPLQSFRELSEPHPAGEESSSGSAQVD